MIVKPYQHVLLPFIFCTLIKNHWDHYDPFVRLDQGAPTLGNSVFALIEGELCVLIGLSTPN